MPVKRITPPNAAQKRFFLARQRFVGYGGARGGGKSWAARTKAALLALRYAGIRILLLRRSFPELRENHILPLLQLLYGAAQYKETEKAFVFLNGSRLKFGYLALDSDVTQYQGQEYDVIFIDEATQFSEYQFSALTACLRGANAFPKRMYLTMNPGGVGHDWVKRLFITKSYKNGEKPEDYAFIRATVYDNPALLERDPGYVKMLENLPDDLRRAWLEGDWDVFAGQYFTEFRRELHVVRPFAIPARWRRYFAMDYGLDMLAGYFIAVSDAGCAYVYKEIFESGLIVPAAAEKIKAMTSADERIHSYIAPPDLWSRQKDTGRSMAESFAVKGIRLKRADNNRVQGWMRLKEWLHPLRGPDGEMTARLLIFENCRHLIESLPALLFDESDPNDCASEPHIFTHAPDAIRYFLASRPAPGRFSESEKRYSFNIERPRPSPLGRGNRERVL